MLLVKRDYAIQFAGSFIGIAWSVIQSLSIILIYSIVFMFLNKTDSASNQIGFLFSGLLFWIPIQDMILKSTSILSENRNLIKKSNLGMDLFLLIPFIQMLIQFFILSIPIFSIFFYYKQLNFSFILSYAWIFFIGIHVYFVSTYLATVNILLKDLTPLIRLITQFLFWTLPIVYKPKNTLETISYFNPLFSFLEVFRFLILDFDLSSFTLYLLIYPICFSSIIFFLTKRRLHKIILDHL